MSFCFSFHTAPRFSGKLTFSFKALDPFQDFCGKLRATDHFPKITTSNSHALFVDEGVYTKNRNFRLYLSSKFGKDSILSLVRTTPAPDGQSDDKNVFLDSLVTEVNTVHLLQFADSEEVPAQSHSTVGHF